MTIDTTAPVAIGRTDIKVAPLGVGAWAWGDTGMWGYGGDYDKGDVAGAFWSSINAGLTLFDTAEIYGRGVSEQLLGQLARSTEAQVVIASKFAPLPWRLEAGAVRRALEASLRRLGTQRIDLYQIHWPLPLLSIPRLMDALADAVQEGLIRAIGVSNYSSAQMHTAHAALARRGVPLAANQVEYSLLTRAPEVNGVLTTCRALNVTLIAYSPLAMGLLTGKYTPEQRPSGTRRLMPRFSAANLQALQPAVALLREIGAAHGDRTPGQVALNWLIQQGTLPIPGAKNARQARENAGAIGWSLSAEEVARLDEATLRWRGKQRKQY